MVIVLAVAYTGIDWLMVAAATWAHGEAAASGAPVQVMASDVLATLSLLVLIAAYVATGIWLSRARHNADLITPDQQRWSKAWVWLSWIVPVICYYAPKQVVDDVWRSTVRDPAGPRTGWWWGTWIAAMVAGLLFRVNHTSGNEVIHLWIDAVADTVALVFWISVVRTVSHAQDALAGTADSRFALAGDFGRAAVAPAGGPLQQRPDPSVATSPVAPPAGSGAGYTSWYSGAAPPGPRAGPGVHEPFSVTPGSLASAPPTAVAAPYYGAPESRTPPHTRKPRSKVPPIPGIACVVIVLAAVASFLLFVILSPTPAGTIVGEPISVGPEPYDVVAGDGFVWTANLSGTISRVNPKDATSQEINVGGQPSALKVDQGAVWVWNYSDAITRVDVRTGQVSQPLSSGTPIDGIAVGGGYVWLSNSANGTVTRINMQTQALEGGPIAVGPKPLGMAFGDKRLYVVNSGDNTISTLDGPTGQVLGTPLKIEQKVWGIDVYDGVIYAGTTEGVTPIDEQSLVIGEPIPLTSFNGFAVGGGSMWVAYPLDDVVRRIDLQTRQPHGEPIDGIGKGLTNIIFADNVLWVSNSKQNTVTQIHPSP